MVVILFLKRVGGRALVEGQGAMEVIKVRSGTRPFTTFQDIAKIANKVTNMAQNLKFYFKFSAFTPL